jgi:hypothetical protein
MRLFCFHKLFLFTIVTIRRTCNFQNLSDINPKENFVFNKMATSTANNYTATVVLDAERRKELAENANAIVKSGKGSLLLIFLFV